jgi:hypothetical protein
MSHPIIRALGDYLQLSSAEGLLHALKLEPRRSVLSRTLSSLKLLGTGIVIGRGIDMYADTILDYANRGHKRTMPRALWTAGAVAVGAAIGVGAVVLLVPEIAAELSGRAKSRSSSTSSSASYPVGGSAAASGETAPTNGATG